jgi:hypothetical protein
VAGIIGGTTFGVAKQVRIHSVRVVDCDANGTPATLLAGMNWVAANHTKPAVANMSVGANTTAAIDAAANGMINKGVILVAARRGNFDACTKSPSRVPKVITVGATDSSDGRPGSSNFGTCLDVFAPGSAITSAWHTSNTATNTIDDASLASAYAAGVAALYLQSDKNATVAQVAAAIVNGATKNRVRNSGAGSPNNLLFSLISAVPGTTSPAGITTDRTPTYKWTPVTGATKYQIQVFKGATLVVNTAVASSACNATRCTKTLPNTLAFAAHKWRVRAFIGAWKPFSAFNTFTVSATIPVPQAPSGLTEDDTPTYQWTKLTNATKYQYQVFQGATLIFARTVTSGACTAVCTHTPAVSLTDGSYTWRVRAQVGGAWKAFSVSKSFTVQTTTTPLAGYWQSTDTWHDFFVTPDQSFVDNFRIFISVPWCEPSGWTIFRTVLDPIVDNQFSFNGPFFASGTFDSATSAHGTDGLASFEIPGCGPASIGPLNWVANWINSSQPEGVLEGAADNLAQPGRYPVVERVNPP